MYIKPETLWSRVQDFKVNLKWKFSLKLTCCRLCLHILGVVHSPLPLDHYTVRIRKALKDGKNTIMSFSITLLDLGQITKFIIFFIYKLRRLTKWFSIGLLLAFRNTLRFFSFLLSQQLFFCRSVIFSSFHHLSSCESSWVSVFLELLSSPGPWW